MDPITNADIEAASIAIEKVSISETETDQKNVESQHASKQANKSENESSIDKSSTESDKSDAEESKNHKQSESDISEAKTDSTPEINPASATKGGREISNKILYVGCLNKSLTADAIKEIFSVGGPIFSVNLLNDKNNLGFNYAFIEFEQPELAQESLTRLNGTVLAGSEIRINWAYQSYSISCESAEEPLFNIFVGDLLAEVDDVSLNKAFSKFESLKLARVMWDMQTSRSRGYGFVNFTNKQDAELALQTMNGEWISGRSIRLNWASYKDMGAGNNGYQLNTNNNNTNNTNVNTNNSNGHLSHHNNQNNNRRYNNTNINHNNNQRYNNNGHTYNNNNQIHYNKFNNGGYKNFGNQSPKIGDISQEPQYGQLDQGIEQSQQESLQDHFQPPVHQSQQPQISRDQIHYYNSPQIQPGALLPKDVENQENHPYQQHKQQNHGSINGPSPYGNGTVNCNNQRPMPTMSPQSYDIVLRQTPSWRTTVYLGNIAHFTEQSDLIPLLQNFGYIVDFKFHPEKGCAFVKYDSHERAAMVIVQLAGFNLNGRPLKCGWGKDRPPMNHQYNNFRVSPQMYQRQ